jgi:lipopolysaccharide biosynthesis protein
MEDKVKYIAFYLPQFHPIPENDKWWGEGFTEWTNVKNAKPLYRGHQQPVVPGKLGYYNLLEGDIQQEQSKMALEYGISAFCYYHYWMGGGNMLLEKPAERMLKDKIITIPFCFCWANEDWTRSWYGKSSEILMPQLYGNEDEISKHLEYLVPFFKDDRYLKYDDKIVFMVHNFPALPKKHIENYRELLWKKYQLEFYFISGYKDRDWHIDYSLKQQYDVKLSNNLSQAFATINLKFKNRVLKKLMLLNFLKPLRYDYKNIVSIVKNEYLLYSENIPMVFPNWDDTPRKGMEGVVIVNGNLNLYKEMCRAAEVATLMRKKDNFIFIKSWNEWAEGNYLEPQEN